MKCSWDPTVPYPLTDERLWLLSWKYVGNNLSVDAQKRKNCNKGMDSQRFFKWVLLFISLFKLTIYLLSLYLRVTRKLTSNAAYFRDLTKKWYLLFSWGKTSTYHHSYNRVLYLTSQQPLQGTNFVGMIWKEMQLREKQMKEGGVKEGEWRKKSLFSLSLLPRPSPPTFRVVVNSVNICVSNAIWDLLIKIFIYLSGKCAIYLYLQFLIISFSIQKV